MEMAERLSTERREKAALRRQLIKIAVPIAIQGVVSTTLGLVDDLMVGFLGEVELAAVGVGTQIFMIHYMLIYEWQAEQRPLLRRFMVQMTKRI